MSEELKLTPLNSFHRKYGGRLVPFAGWEMPVQYTSILDEHKAVRSNMGLFDVSHMGEIVVSGSEAKSFLDSIVTNSMSLLVDGKAIYALMCYSDGGVVDDIIIYQVTEQEFVICVNASNIEKDFEWIVEKAVGFDCSVTNRSDDFGQIAIQGPNAIPFLEKLTGHPLSEIKRFHFRTLPYLNAQCIFSRTGYTGEDGFEIYAPADNIADIAETIYKAGKEQGLILAGLGARDSLRLEAGYPLYGHEIDTTIDPLTAGLSWAVKFNKGSTFLGQEALLDKKVHGLSQSVKYFILDDRRIARAGDDIVTESGEIAGKVLSGTLSPIINKAMGSALLDSKILESHTPLYADLRGKKYRLTLKKPPLHL